MSKDRDKRRMEEFIQELKEEMEAVEKERQSFVETWGSFNSDLDWNRN